MKKEELHILMLEDNDLDAELNQEQLLLLEDYDCKVKVIQDRASYIEEITGNSPPDLILCDYNMPMYNGIEALKELEKRKLLIPFIFVTGTLQEEVAANAIKSGAWEYVVKDRLFRLPLAIKGALKLKKEKEIAIEADNRTQKIIRGIDKTSVVVVVIDKDYIIDYANQNFTQVTGFKQSDVLGKSVFSVFAHIDPNLLNRLHDILKQKEAFTGDFPIINKNKCTIWERITITPIFDKENALYSYTIITDDISEQKKLEDDLKKSLNELQILNTDLEYAKNKAEESDKLKTAFLANLSHEIRTPMNGIIGFAGLLKSENLSPETINTYIDIIEKSGNRMINLINDLVDISKIEANLVVINPHNIKLNPLIDELYNFFNPLASQKGLSFTYSKGLDDSNDSIIIDKLKLEQILSILLNNALKFTEKGEIHFKYNILNGHLVFNIKDTGIGIPAGMEEIIFQRFRQTDNTYSRNTEGMGLGLSISKSFIEKMGGAISVKSKLGEGSDFCIQLPYVTSN